MESEGEVNDYCYFCGKVGASYSMKRPGYATEEVSIHKGCYLAPKAEGPATKEPEQSPPLPSGVVDALISTLSKVCTYIESKEDMRSYSALTPGKGLHTEVLFHIADLADLRASLPQAPATPAAAPAEVPKISYPNVGENGYGVDVDYFRRELARLAESLPNRPGDELARYLRNLADTAAPKTSVPGSQGVEGSKDALGPPTGDCTSCGHPAYVGQTRCHCPGGGPVKSRDEEERDHD